MASFLAVAGLYSKRCRIARIEFNRTQPQMNRRKIPLRRGPVSGRYVRWCLGQLETAAGRTM